MRRLSTLIAVVGILLLINSTRADVPNSVTVQGRLTDGFGDPVLSGTKTFTFKIFDSESGGSEIWPGGAGEDQVIVSDDNGLWSASVGSIIPLTTTVFTDTARWLEVTVDDGVNPPETLPRIRLVTGPYAYRVSTVDGASGGNIISPVSIGEGHTLGAASIVSGTLNSATANAGTSAIIGGSGNTMDGFASMIAAGSGNTVSGNHSLVAGEGNTVSAEWSTIAGGANNEITSENSFIGGGLANDATGAHAVVGGGQGNRASGFESTIGGGESNEASGLQSFVGGGFSNKARNSFAVVAGGGSLFSGDSNSAQGSTSAILGGKANIASGDSSTVGGGSRNTASGDGSTIGGGFFNTASSEQSTVSGGRQNTASGARAVVAGGLTNTANGQHTFIGGGQGNVVSGFEAAIGGGESNEASGVQSYVGGGFSNKARNSFTVIAGGGGFNTADSSSASGWASAILGGTANIASGDSSAIGGGCRNTAEGTSSTIGGGRSNVAAAAGSTVGGGSFNQARGQYSVICGGGGSFVTDSNFAGGTRSVIGGGRKNEASGGLTVISGGETNDAIGSLSTIGGGQANIANGSRSVISGGVSNRTGGVYSVVPGGLHNWAIGDNSFAAGEEARALHDGTFVWADASQTIFSSTDAKQFLIRASGGVGIGTNAPAARLHVTGGTDADPTGGGSFVSGSAAGTNLVMDDNEIMARNNGAVSDLFLNNEGGDVLISPTGGGRVGIGTNSPDCPLHVQFGSAGSVTGNGNAAAVLERSGDCWLQILSPNGTQRGILFGEPSNSIQGSIRYNPPGAGKGYHFRCGNNSVRLILDSLGNLTADGCIVGSNIACTSDGRLKHEVETLTDAIDEIQELRGVSYLWKTEEYPERELPAGEQIGLIAQEVKEVVPQAVIEQSDGYLAVDYARLVPLLIEAVKEQQVQINELKSRLDSQTQ